MKYLVILTWIFVGCETSGEFSTGELGSPDDTDGAGEQDDPPDTGELETDEQDDPEDTDELDDTGDEDSPEDTGELYTGPGEGFLACHEISEAEYCNGAETREMWSLTWKPYLDGCVAVMNVRYCPNECVSEWDTDEDGNTFMDYYCI